MKVKDVKDADLIVVLLDGEFKVLDRSIGMLEDYDVKEVFTNCYGEKVVRILDMHSDVR